MKRKEIRPIFVWPLAMSILIVLSLVIYHLTIGPVPVVHTLQWDNDSNIVFPLHLSRWWDILLGLIFPIVLITLASNNRSQYDASIPTGLSFSFGLCSIFTSVFFGLCPILIFALALALFFGLVLDLGFGILSCLGFAFGLGIVYGLVPGLLSGFMLCIGFGSSLLLLAFSVTLFQDLKSFWNRAWGWLTAQ